MPGWPTVADVKREVGISIDADDTAVAHALEAGILGVQDDIGTVGCVRGHAPTSDEPCSKLVEAALLLAVSNITAPKAPHGVAGVFDTGGVYVARSNPHYVRLIRGHRAKFGIA